MAGWSSSSDYYYRILYEVYHVLSKDTRITPQARLIAGFGAAGFIAANIAFHAALEHSLGFNRFMFGITEYIRTSRYPSLELIGNYNNLSNFLPDFDFTRILDLFSPVEHSIPLSTLINLHFRSLLCLFVIVFCMTFLFIYFCVNIFIIYNKDYLLGKVKNKYAIWYVKYVIFRSKVDIVILAIFILYSQCFMLYVLHYLIVHPIIINS